VARKKMWVEYPDDGELSEDRDTPGAKSALVRDADNKLITHAKLYNADEDEDYDNNDDGGDAGSSGSNDDGGALVLGLLAVAGLIGVGVVEASRRRKDRAQEMPSRAAKKVEASSNAVPNLRVSAPAGWYDDGQGRLRWWDGETWTEHLHLGNPRVGAPAGWYDDGSGRQRWWDGHEWTGVFQSALPAVTTGPPTLSAAREHGSYDMAFPATNPITMTKAEWQERVRTMIIARSISELQWRLLSQARIEDADADLLAWQAELQKLTPQQFSADLDRALASDPDLHHQVVNGATSGWYDDGSGRQRWWDGAAWTHVFRAELVPTVAQPRGVAQRRASIQPNATASAGWYDDGSGRQRWWDGQRWTEYYA